MPSRRLTPATIVCAALAVLLGGCAPADAPSVVGSASTPAQTASAGVESAPSETAPSQASLEGISMQEMTHQPVPVQMTQCLTQHAKWIDLPAGTTSSDLYTRISAYEQELLFLLPDAVGGFDNVDVAAAPSPRGTVTVFVVGSAEAGDEAAAAWTALRDASPEVEAAAAGIEAEGASFAPELVEYSYAELCTSNLAILSVWMENDKGLVTARMDVELNRNILGIEPELFSDEYRQQLLALGPAGIYEFEEVR